MKRGERREATAQEQLARWNLMKAKMETNGAEASFIKKVLGNLSEVEEIRMKVLEGIIDYKESTPEFAQIYNLTGSKDPYEQADWLAEKIYEQQRAEIIMGLYTPGKDVVKSMFVKNTTKGLATRGARLEQTALGVGYSEDSAATKAFRGILWGAAPNIFTKPRD